MKNEIKYNVNVVVNTGNKSKEEIIKDVNKKLAKLIVIFEQKCQG